MLEAASAVLGAATTAVAPGTTLSEAAPGTTLSEVALDRTFLARVLPYALDALYQMPLMHIEWAKKLCAPLYAAATCPPLLALSAHGHALTTALEEKHPPKQAALATALATAPGGSGAVLGTPKDASCAAGRSGVVPGADPPQHVALIESVHPLPAEPAPMLQHICLEGATNLCLTFDPRCATTLMTSDGL